MPKIQVNYAFFDCLPSSSYTKFQVLRVRLLHRWHPRHSVTKRWSCRFKIVWIALFCDSHLSGFNQTSSFRKISMNKSMLLFGRNWIQACREPEVAKIIIVWTPFKCPKNGGLVGAISSYNSRNRETEFNTRSVFNILKSWKSDQPNERFKVFAFQFFRQVCVRYQFRSPIAKIEPY